MPKLPSYPTSHKVGMKVPYGGSNCAKCEYLNLQTRQDCRERHFVQWNGGHHIPAPVDSYCCDFFETRGSSDG